MMEFNTVLSKRYSCKKYSEKQIPQELIQNVLEAGRIAPTAKNLQEQRIYVLQSEEALRIVDEITPCRYGAPVVLAVAYDRSNVFVYPGGQRDSGAEDASIVATYLMLAAENEGLNSCWINYFDPEAAKEKLNLPENEELLMFLDLGYAAEGDKPLPNHFSRKDLSETVRYFIKRNF